MSNLCTLALNKYDKGINMYQVKIYRTNNFERTEDIINDFLKENQDSILDIKDLKIQRPVNENGKYIISFLVQWG